MEETAGQCVPSCGDFTDMCPVELYFQYRGLLRLQRSHASQRRDPEGRLEAFKAQNNSYSAAESGRWGEKGQTQRIFNSFKI